MPVLIADRPESLLQTQYLKQLTCSHTHVYFPYRVEQHHSCQCAPPLFVPSLQVRAVPRLQVSGHTTGQGQCHTVDAPALPAVWSQQDSAGHQGRFRGTYNKAPAHGLSSSSSSSWWAFVGAGEQHCRQAGGSRGAVVKVSG